MTRTPTLTRVLQIVAGLDIGNTFGGAERSGVELALALSSDRQYQVQVCAFWRADHKCEAQIHWLGVLEHANVPVSFATDSAPSRSLSHIAWGMRSIAHRLRQSPVDIAHAHHEGGALTATVLKLRRQARVALRTVYVPTAREWGIGFGAAAMRSVFTSAVFPLVMDAEIAVSPAFQSSLNRRLFARLLKRHAQMIYNTSSKTPGVKSVREAVQAVWGKS